MSNPIGWCTHTINPVVGCLNGCSYCYARAMAPHVAAMTAGASGKPVCEKCRDFIPHLHPERLDKMLQYGNTRHRRRYFVGSMCDLWSDGVDPEWRRRIWAQIRYAEDRGSNAVYIVLTKRPLRIDAGEITSRHHPEWIDERPWPLNLWIGMNVTGQELDPRPGWSALCRSVPEGHRILSVEPLLGNPYVLQDEPYPDWVLLGPQTPVKPLSRRMAGEQATVERIVEATGDRGIALWMKDGCAKAWPDVPMVQELPEGMGDGAVPAPVAPGEDGDLGTSEGSGVR